MQSQFRSSQDKANLRAIPVGEDDMMILGDFGDGCTSGPHVLALVLCRYGLPSLKEGVPAQSDDNAHYAPNVATSTALMVCIRFSA